MSIEVEYRFTSSGLVLADDEPVRLVSATPDQVVLADDGGVAHASTSRATADDVYVDSPRGPVHLIPLPRFPDPAAAVAPGSLVAPMPGTVVRLGARGRRHRHRRSAAALAGGDEDGAHDHRAADGVLTELDVAAGQQVEVGAVLARVEAHRHRQRSSEETSDRHQLHRERGTPGAAQGRCARWAANYGQRVLPARRPARGEHTDELWTEAGKLGYLGVNLPEEYGGGGAGIYELSLVMEELAAAGCAAADDGGVAGHLRHGHRPFGTDEQKQRWLPGLADGSIDDGLRASPSPTPDPTRTRSPPPPAATAATGSSPGQKVFISGVDQAQAVLVVGRTEDAKTGKLRPALFVVPTDAPGFSYTPIEMELISPERQFQLFLDDVRLPADALVGAEDAAIAQLFAGPEPRTHHGRGQLGRHGAVRAGQGRRLRQDPPGLVDPDRRPPGPRRIRWRSATSRSNWPG